MSQIFESDFKNMTKWTPLWVVSAIFGDPVYNAIAFLICDSIGFIHEVSTNTTQITIWFYVLILLIIFGLRYITYRLVYMIKLKIPMSTYFFIEGFAERHRFQVLGLVTFFMWAGEVEGNIAGFIYFPLTIVLACSIGIITFVRLINFKKYIEKSTQS